MDNNLLFIIIGSTVIFVGIILWKLRWFYKKMIDAEQKESNTE